MPAALLVFSTLTLPGCAFVSDADLASRLDGDGDGIGRPEDCDDEDPTVGAERTWFVDADGDGFGGTVTATQCQADAGLSAVGDDCDDANPAVYPGAPEVCNGADDDCDTVADDGVEPPDWYFDGDDDGYGDPARPLGETSCSPPEGYVDSNTDCNDADPTLNPTTPWYPDADGDGYGDTSQPMLSCVQPPGRIRDGADCDDVRADVSPAGQEVCDGLDVDEDCDGAADDADPSAGGQTLWYADSDADGLGTVFHTTWACDAPVGYAGNRLDCDDDDHAVTRECLWVQVSAGEHHTCGLLGDGTVKCWGYDSHGALTPPDEGFVQISTGAQFACGVLASGQIRCWGYDGDGQTDAPAGTFTQVDVDYSYACATSTDGTITCWGTPPWGDPPPTGAGFQTVRTGYTAACALDSAGNVSGWYGATSATGPYVDAQAFGADCVRLDPTGELSNLPASWDGLVVQSGVAAFSAKGFNGALLCTIDTSGAVACTGGDGQGQDQPPTGHFVSISAGENHACGITSEGAALCWGADGNGECDVPTE